MVRRIPINRRRAACGTKGTTNGRMYTSTVAAVQVALHSASVRINRSKRPHMDVEEDYLYCENYIRGDVWISCFFGFYELCMFFFYCVFFVLIKARLSRVISFLYLVSIIQLIKDVLLFIFVLVWREGGAKVLKTTHQVKDEAWALNLSNRLFCYGESYRLG